MNVERRTPANQLACGKRTMRKSKKLYVMIALLLVCITVNIVGVNQTMAWFVSGGLLGTGEYSTAKVQYLPTLEPTADEKSKYGSLIKGSSDDSITFLIPGDPIIEKFGQNSGYLSLENFSTVESEVRVCIECNFINTIPGTTEGTTVDELDKMTDFVWKSMGNDVYQFGKNYTTDTGTSIFMGLLEVTFVKKMVKDTDYPGYVKPAGDENDPTPYNWVFQKGTYPADKVDFTNCWNLKLNGNTIIPPSPYTDNDQQGRAYNVITDIKIVGENQDHQTLFDQYFSNNYAGKRLQIAVKYYAKQTMGMEWSLFGKELLTTVTPPTP